MADETRIAANEQRTMGWSPEIHTADLSTVTMPHVELPHYEQGDEGFLAYLGVEGDCCSSCASDAWEGIEIPTFELRDGNRWIEVECCCRHVKSVMTALRERGVDVR